MKRVALLILIFSIFFQNKVANALPAFARRENVSCVMCHTDSSAPHLTEFGYMYRRMAFHWPGRLGDEKADEVTLNVTNHLAVGVSVAYQYVENLDPQGTKTTSANGLNVPEVELWPLVGGFFGHWGVWTEIDSVPPTNTDGGVALSLGDLRYAFGNEDSFINFRAGMIAPEGFGASDQWFDDANIPPMDNLAANRNQDTRVTPWGAMASPEIGFEVGFNKAHSHLTLGIYNGYTNLTKNADGTFSDSGTTTAATTKKTETGMRDYRVQLDQFIGTAGAFTVGYYDGTIPMMDPIDGKTFSWFDHFKQERVYLTEFAIPGTLDLLAGLGWAQNQFVIDNPTPVDSFENRSGFLGVIWYVKPHLTISGRGDKFYFNSSDSATGYSLQVSAPFENQIVVFHVNQMSSSLAGGALGAGMNTDAGLVLRFLL